MKKLLFKLLVLGLVTCSGASALAHVPALLLPLKGTPITSYFLGQSDISRAIYSELTLPGDLFIAHFSVAKGNEPSLVQILVPVCQNLPQYERFQPSVFIIKGDLPWKNQGETNAEFAQRIEAGAVVKAASRFQPGQ